MKGKRIIIGAGILLLIVAWFLRVCWMNEKYPDVEKEYYSIGEMISIGNNYIYYDSMDGYEVRVNRARILTYQELLDAYQIPEEIRDQVENMDPLGAPEKVFDIDITLRNTDNKDTGISFSDWNVQSNDLFVDLNPDLYFGVNPGIETTSVALRENSEMDFHLIYNLRQSVVSSQVWDEIENYPMRLTISCYPVKKMIRLN